MTINTKIKHHQAQLKKCTQCPDMFGPPVTGNPIASPIMLIGQAPGDKEIIIPKPFAWTAGKTLFKWFKQLGVDENDFRNLVYIAAVCRCFPGKKPRGGDRVPNLTEIKTCSHWLNAEIDLLQPKLVIPVGKLAISQYLSVKKLTDVIGQIHQVELNGIQVDMIPLPHPSGASTWHITEPGKSLLQNALQLINNHPVWKKQTE
ncbi:MAG: uracil-DNA glycosylase family protein [Gammaproteobacteria bacterium]|nr:uracil-DNA glycosylase family protein [Gammaproteobacteria bacterium]